MYSINIHRFKLHNNSYIVMHCENSNFTQFVSIHFNGVKLHQILSNETIHFIAFNFPNQIKKHNFIRNCNQHLHSHMDCWSCHTPMLDLCRCTGESHYISMEWLLRSSQLLCVWAGSAVDGSSWCWEKAVVDTGWRWWLRSAIFTGRRFELRSAVLTIVDF